jgi:glucose-1-phosphate thymidylyltransferase
MLYYPLSVLQQAGIREVLIIVPPDDKEQFERLLGDGGQLGMQISYKEQFVQRGIADAFIVGEEFIGDDSVCLVLGDNLFYGAGLKDCLEMAQQNKTGATIFGCYVEDPRAFGVVEFDENGKAISIEEKPEQPKSNYIVPGLYLYDNHVIEIAKQVKPSARGELEITAVNNAYLELDELNVVTLGKDFVWLDAGTEDSLLEAAQVIQNLQRTTGNYVACIEEGAYKNGWITYKDYQHMGKALEKTRYGKYILSKCEA